MPKVIITEKDNTTSTANTLDDFAVLVPGLVDISKKYGSSEDDNTIGSFEKVADENGVYKVSSLADFKANVGLVPATLKNRKFYRIKETVSGSKASIGDIANIETPVVSAVVKASTVQGLLLKAEQTNTTAADSITMKTLVHNHEDDTDTAKTISVLITTSFTASEGTASSIKKSKVKEAASSTVPGLTAKDEKYILCYAIENSDSGENHQPGELKTADLKFVQITTAEKFNELIDTNTEAGHILSAGKMFMSNDALYLIKESEKGKDIADKVEPVDFVQYGNQMAYELISLGYPVLYKSLGYIDPENTFDLATLKTDANSNLDVLEDKNKLMADGFKYDAIQVDLKDELMDITGIMNELSVGKLSDSDIDFWAPLMDKAEYNFRFVVNGLVNNNRDANTKIATLAAAASAEGTIENNLANVSTLGSVRGDATALCDIPEEAYVGKNRQQIITGVTKYVNDSGFDKEISKYAAYFMPLVSLTGLKSEMAEYNDNTTLPASFYYLACAKKALDEGYPEWFAVAGFTRGISKYTVKGVKAKIGDAVINALEPRAVSTTDGLKRAVNVVATIRGNQYLWGNRTAFDLNSADQGDLVASHFLNIRQLCTTLKKVIYAACRKFTFDPNSDVLWFNFCNAIRPTLDKMKANQGINDYKIVRISTAKRATLKARIRIVPVEAVEDFFINVSLEDILGQTAVSVSDNM